MKGARHGGASRRAGSGERGGGRRPAASGEEEGSRRKIGQPAGVRAVGGNVQNHEF